MEPQSEVGGAGFVAIKDEGQTETSQRQEKAAEEDKSFAEDEEASERVSKLISKDWEVETLAVCDLVIGARMHASQPLEAINSMLSILLSSLVLHKASDIQKSFPEHNEQTRLVTVMSRHPEINTSSYIFACSMLSPCTG